MSQVLQYSECRVSFRAGCTICRDASRQMAGPLTGCLSPNETSSYNICRRQPPPLKELAFHINFTLTLNIDRFGLSVALLIVIIVTQPTRIEFIFNDFSLQISLPSPSNSITTVAPITHHIQPVPRVAMDCCSKANLEFVWGAFVALYAHKEYYWCKVCDKPLFFKIDCPFHEENGAEEYDA